MTLTERLKTEWREATVGVLTVLLICLVAAYAAFPASTGSAAAGGGGTATDGRIDSAIGVTLGHFGIDIPADKLARRIQSPGAMVRREIRIRVPETFPSLLLNHELDRRLQPLGARVFAAENSQEKRIAIHIRKDGVIIRTLIFQESNEH